MTPDRVGRKEGPAMAHAVRMDTDVAIVGGGPAGCTLARELSKKGKKVILVEKGRDDDRLLGSGLGVFLRLEKGFHLPLPLKKTAEGDTVILATCLGGGTLLYAGSAFEPDMDYWKRHGIEIPRELIDEAREECWVNTPPDEFIGPGTRRIWEAATDLGLPFERFERHIDFSKCRIGCEYCTMAAGGAPSGPPENSPRRPSQMGPPSSLARKSRA